MLPRESGAHAHHVAMRGLRGRGAEEDGALARPERPSRCTLPITALRVMPPSSAAIWLADRPSAQSFFSSLDPFVGPGHELVPAVGRARCRGRIRPRVRAAPAGLAPTPRYDVLRNCPPHEMSYLNVDKLQYGESWAQESARLTSTCSCYFDSSIPQKACALSFRRRHPDRATARHRVTGRVDSRKPRQ